MITNRGGRSPVAGVSDTTCTVCGSSARFAYRTPEADLYRCRSCSHCFADQQSLRNRVEYDHDYGDRDHRNWFENPNLKLFGYVTDRLGRAPQRSVLDVGCGRGAFLSYLHQQRPAWRLAGVEVAPFDPPSGIELIVADFESTDLGRRFDAVVSLAVIEHVTDPHKFLRRVLECCEPGGQIVLMTLNEQSILYDTSRVLRRAGITGPFEQLYSTHHLHHFTKRSFAQLLAEHGLVVEARRDHHIPLAAVDFPPRNAVLDGVQRAGAAATFALGKAVGRCYLQTVVCRAPA